jgi:DNA-binding transcriptional MerR regulator
MLKIGEFAQLAQVTVRTLRYYDEVGLLKPAHVDRFTGYRYYSRDQLWRLHRILTLKDLGLSLEQIAPLLDDDVSSGEIRGMLRLKAAQLESQMREVETQLTRVKAWLEQIEKVPTLAGGRVGKEIVTMMAEDKYPKVVLEKAVQAFSRVEREIKHWQPRSYVQAQLVCMYAAGWEEADYETIMTVSGYGPSFSYHPKELWWSQYAPPRGCDERIAQATGFGWEWKRYETAEAYWQVLKETIDAGKPIHAAYLEEVVFVGYQDADDRAERKVRPLAPHGVGVEPGTWWTWQAFEKWFEEHSYGNLGRHTEKTQQVSTRASATEVLETMLTMAHDDPRAKNESWAGVRWGLEGLEAYAADVGDMSKSGVPGEYFYNGWMGCHAIYPQVSGRASAAVYLKRLAESEVFADGVNAHILAAAREYEAARAAWGEYEKHLGNEETAEASDSWMIEKHRLAGAAAIRQARAHEETALERVRQVLVAIQ